MLLLLGLLCLDRLLAELSLAKHPAFQVGMGLVISKCYFASLLLVTATFALLYLPNFSIIELYCELRGCFIPSQLNVLTWI